MFGEIQFIQCDSVVVGYFCLTYGYSLDTFGRDCCIDELYIAEAYRNQGIGTEAMRHIERHLRGAGFTSLYGIWGLSFCPQQRQKGRGRKLRQKRIPKLKM